MNLFFCNLTPAPVRDFNPFECDDYAFHAIEERVKMEENNAIPCDVNDSKREASRLFFEEKVHDSSGFLEENECVTNGNKGGDEFFKIMDKSLEHKESEDESPPKKDDQESDKHVMDLELPEAITYYRENSSNSVKDICVDEGVPIVDKKLIENMDDDSVGNVDKNENAAEDVQKDMTSEVSLKVQENDIDAAKNGVESLASDVQISSWEDYVNKGTSKDTCLEDLMNLFGPKCSTTKQTADDFPEQQYFGYNPFLQESSYEELDSQSSEETISESHPTTVPTNAESNKNESCASDFNDSKEATIDDTAEKISKQRVDSDSMPNHEEDIPNETLAAPAIDVESGNISKIAENPFGNPSLQEQFADGEASFSSVGPISGLITYSGTIPYSGNISLRSDSSTTSARSFAFPVLQSEWNSSPVRMAKADRRFRKSRSWRQGLLCCRF